jgi:hypothetical protein
MGQDCNTRRGERRKGNSGRCQQLVVTSFLWLDVESWKLDVEH